MKKDESIVDDIMFDALNPNRVRITVKLEPEKPKEYNMNLQDRLNYLEQLVCSLVPERIIMSLAKLSYEDMIEIIRDRMEDDGD
jgi:hypothetical protein